MNSTLPLSINDRYTPHSDTLLDGVGLGEGRECIGRSAVADEGKAHARGERGVDTARRVELNRGAATQVVLWIRKLSSG